MHTRLLFTLLYLLVLSSNCFAAESPMYFVFHEGNIDKTTMFAVEELGRYSDRILGRKSVALVKSDNIDRNSIYIATGKSEPVFNETRKSLLSANATPSDSYYLISKANGVVISGNNSRGLLYGVYHFLRLQGCRWPMPTFDYCSEFSEFIPQKTKLDLENITVNESPAFHYRGGLCVTMAHKNIREDRLLQLADWMAKNRLNVFGIHIQILPKISANFLDELSKRGFYLSAEGHAWEFFKKEYGLKRLSLNTLVSAAASFHEKFPRIDYYGPWGDDNSGWEYETPVMTSPVERAQMFTNKLHSKLGSRTKLIYPAYQKLLYPSRSHRIQEDVIIYLCPIDKDHGKRLYDKSSKKNAAYIQSLSEWRAVSPSANIVYYTYFRKHAWNSLPVNTPSLMFDEFSWSRENELYGAITYYMDSDWLSYDLQNFAFAALCWGGAETPIALIDRYIEELFGTKSESFRSFFLEYEDFVLRYDGGGYWGYKLKGLAHSIQKNPEYLAKLDSLSNMLNSMKLSEEQNDYVAKLRKWIEHWRLKMNVAAKMNTQPDFNDSELLKKILISPEYYGFIADYVPNTTKDMSKF